MPKLEIDGEQSEPTHGNRPWATIKKHIAVLAGRQRASSRCSIRFPSLALDCIKRSSRGVPIAAFGRDAVCV
jgi:hypothetical protein